MLTISNTIDGDVNVVKLVGRLDVKAARDIDSAFAEAATAAPNVVLDFSELDYIASYAGLADDDSVEVRCEVLDNPLRAVVQLIDEGVPFDPLAADDPDISPEALEARDGGLGIYMVKQMMDEVTYAYKDGKNTLTITKNL